MCCAICQFITVNSTACYECLVLNLKTILENLYIPSSVRHYTQISRNEYLLLIITLYIDLSTPGQHGGFGCQRRIGTDEYLQVAPERERKQNTAIDCVKC